MKLGNASVFWNVLVKSEGLTKYTGMNASPKVGFSSSCYLLALISFKADTVMC